MSLFFFYFKTNSNILIDFFSFISFQNFCVIIFHGTFYIWLFSILDAIFPESIDINGIDEEDEQKKMCWSANANRNRFWVGGAYFNVYLLALLLSFCLSYQQDVDFSISKQYAMGKNDQNAAKLKPLHIWFT